MAEMVPTIHENQKPTIDIPKSREIFTGDINDAVITVQKVTGFEITPEWWFTNVGNNGTTEDILDKFDTAFEVFVHEQMGITLEKSDVIPEEQVVAEADTELSKFDERFGDDPGFVPLRKEFLDALEKHLQAKYLSETDIIPTETDGYSGEVRVLDDIAEIKITSGIYPELERFQVINEAPINKLFGANIATAESGQVIQKVPTHVKINEVHQQVFGEEPNHLEVTLLDDEGITEIRAKTYWQFLANGQIPIAGAKDANYFIHDRAVDDHVLGWVVSPKELDEFIQKAGQSMIDINIDTEKLKESVAAYDFLTSTIALYAWRTVNGEDAPLPLRGDVNDTVENQTIEAENRLSYAPEAIQQMVHKIELNSGQKLGISTLSLLENIELRAKKIAAVSKRL